MKKDIYETITNRIVADLEKGVRPWMQPWNAEHTAGRITRPLRGNGSRIAGSTSSCYGRKRWRKAIPRWSG
ncbi:ArdC-like ssDNA-binding domain-containing protein [Rhizobium leguminosarum]|uniref:ArdC-like ssDNA-binding domain-containing protein n=1 Tax=Rhizobium leguminosarum TaxID=384 RepID=UPI003D7C28BB